MKMSDVFNLPVYDCDGSVMCQGVIKHSQPHAEICMKAISYTGNDDNLARHAVHAINNHDRLTKENAELRDILIKHKEFNEHMHEMPIEWTIKRSIELHKKTIDLLNKTEQ